MDDPRQILSEAGVECAEVDAFSGEDNPIDLFLHERFPTSSHAAILALARLVARYKWQRDQSVADHCETGERPAEGVAECEYCSAAIADLDRRWEERRIRIEEGG